MDCFTFNLLHRLRSAFSWLHKHTHIFQLYCNSCQSCDCKQTIQFGSRGFLCFIILLLREKNKLQQTIFRFMLCNAIHFFYGSKINCQLFNQHKEKLAVFCVLCLHGKIKLSKLSTGIVYSFGCFVYFKCVCHNLKLLHSAWYHFIN